MSRLFYISMFLLLSALVLHPFGQAQARCSYRGAQVDVQQKKHALQLERNFSAQHLTATASVPTASGSIVLGNGGGGMQIGGSIKFTVTGSREEGYCPKIQRVNIELQIMPRIKLANTLQPGSCEYNAVYQHEMFHVAVLERTAQSAAQQIPDIINTRLRDVVARMGQNGHDSSYIHRHLQAEFSRTLSIVNDQMSAFMNSEQKKIDNPTEYARVQNSCAFNRRY